MPKALTPLEEAIEHREQMLAFYLTARPDEKARWLARWESADKAVKTIERMEK